MNSSVFAKTPLLPAYRLTSLKKAHSKKMEIGHRCGHIASHRAFFTRRGFEDVGKGSRNTAVSRQLGPSLSSAAPRFLMSTCPSAATWATSIYGAFNYTSPFNVIFVTNTKASIRKHVTLMRNAKLFKINFSRILSYK